METRIYTGQEENYSRVINQGHQNFSSMLPVLRNASEVDKTANILLLDNSLSTKEPASTSDSTPKLIREKEIASYFISRLPSTALFGLITFGEPAKLIIPLQALSEKLTAIRAIQACDFASGTCMKSALAFAKQVINKVPAGYVSRVYLITDGCPTTGCCKYEADTLKASNATLFCIGFGDTSTGEIDEDYMRSLASNSQTEGILYKHFTCANQFTKFMGRQTQTITY